MPPDLLPQLRRMIGFRNRVVHRSIEVDDAQVLWIVREPLGDFEAVPGAVGAARSALRTCWRARTAR